MFFLSGSLYISIFSLLETHLPSYLGIMLRVLMPGNTVPVNVRWKMRKLLKKLAKMQLKSCLKI